MKRLRILITGQVQGVGFRPQVYRVAQALNLTGWVRNNTNGVLIEVQGSDVSNFLNQLLESLPPLARVDEVKPTAIDWVADETGFQILSSEPGESHTRISADTGICAACLEELFDRNSHYYHYPFLNCTHCGPRLSIVHALPYDRAQTTMRDFPLCTACHDDYIDPNNRRYHAQPTACAHCGPQLSSSVETIVEALRAGKIVALKGMGGYQLLVDANNESAVLRLRHRKNREAKPFALMVLNLRSAVALVDVQAEEEEHLVSQARPIVLVRKQVDIDLPSIAPGLSKFGMMLPATPLHYLLFHVLAGCPEGYAWLDSFQPTRLVVTSANLSGNPLLIDDEKAKESLGDIADLVVSYNRAIVTRVDDSVLQVINNAPSFVRRARGFAPEPIKLPFAIPSTLALGAELKQTFCLTRDNEAFVSQHIGGLTNQETIQFFHESLLYWTRFLGVRIERIACDLHPDFYTSRLAETYDLPSVGVQHHHAHLASVAAEHGVSEPAIGLALDGYGYGLDGGAWGGELNFLKEDSFERLGHFQPLNQPGGDVAAREPWRMGASVLHALGMSDQIAIRFQDKPQVLGVTKLLNGQFQMAKTSSCGRWFDAAAALLGVNTVSQYEGQAAMQLESLVTRLEIVPDGWYFDEKQFNILPIFKYLLNVDAIEGANLFHGALVLGLSEWILTWSEKMAVRTVLLGGGCFSNQVLAEGLRTRLSEKGLCVYLPERLPPNDGGLSLGQAWVAGRRA